jgi:hypothetical protein
MQTQTTMPTMSKLTKKFIMRTMRQRLHERTFDRDTFEIEFGLNDAKGDRKIRRYLNEIADEFSEIKGTDIIILKQFCIENLTEKAMNRELDESTETKIALSGEATKLELNGKLTETKNVNINVKSMLAEYEHIITEDRVETQPIPTNSTAKQVHPTETNTETSTVPIN